MKVTDLGGAVKVQGIKDFYLPHIFECGQCFRWNEQEDGSYIGAANGKILHIEQTEDEVIFKNSSIEDFNEIWIDYFDLNRDYGEIKKVLSREDPILKEAIKYSWGIRILKQDVWETLISFVISANRGIAMIKKSIELLCQEYGNFIGVYKGRKYYDFPKAEVLMNQNIERLREIIRTGYRSPYIVKGAIKAVEENIDLYGLKNYSTEEVRKVLLQFPGVGPKVSDCILLFSLGKYDVFPVDVWIKRVIEHIYFLGKEIDIKKVRLFGREKFGKWAGVAQQYLFYYARELKIGKN
jgi:N-glycosylase/DNA lyase